MSMSIWNKLEVNKFNCWFLDCSFQVTNKVKYRQVVSISIVSNEIHDKLEVINSIVDFLSQWTERSQSL